MGDECAHGVVTGQPMPSPRSVPGQPDAALPTGWAMAFDLQDRPFYVNYNQSPPRTTFTHPSLLLSTNNRHHQLQPAGGFGPSGRTSRVAPSPDSNPDGQAVFISLDVRGNTRIVLVGTSAVHVAERLEEIEQREEIEVVRQLAKVTSCCACIDLLCMVPIAWINIWISLFFCVGPLCGIQGCHYYSMTLLQAHLALLFTRLIGWVVLFMSPQMPAPLMLYFIFVIICNMWSFRLAQRLHTVILLMSDLELDFLRRLEHRASPRRAAGL